MIAKFAVDHGFYEFGSMMKETFMQLQIDKNRRYFLWLHRLLPVVQLRLALIGKGVSAARGNLHEDHARHRYGHRAEPIEDLWHSHVIHAEEQQQPERTKAAGTRSELFHRL